MMFRFALWGNLWPSHFDLPTSLTPSGSGPLIMLPLCSSCSQCPYSNNLYLFSIYPKGIRLAHFPDSVWLWIWVEESDFPQTARKWQALACIYPNYYFYYIRPIYLVTKVQRDTQWFRRKTPKREDHTIRIGLKPNPNVRESNRSPQRWKAMRPEQVLPNAHGLLLWQVPIITF